MTDEDRERVNEPTYQLVDAINSTAELAWVIAKLMRCLYLESAGDLDARVGIVGAVELGKADFIACVEGLGDVFAD